MTPDHHAILLADGADGVPAARLTQGDGHDHAGASDGGSDAPDEARIAGRRVASGPQDYPTPRAVGKRDVYDWFEDSPAVDNFAGLGRELAGSGDLYRNPAYAGGLLLALPGAHIPPTPITDPATLDAVITDRQRVRVIKGGNIKGSSVPRRSLRTMLAQRGLPPAVPAGRRRRAAVQVPPRLQPDLAGLQRRRLRPARPPHRRRAAGRVRPGRHRAVPRRDGLRGQRRPHQRRRRGADGHAPQPLARRQAVPGRHQHQEPRRQGDDRLVRRREHPEGLDQLRGGRTGPCRRRSSRPSSTNPTSG